MRLVHVTGVWGTPEHPQGDLLKSEPRRVVEMPKRIPAPRITGDGKLIDAQPPEEKAHGQEALWAGKRRCPQTQGVRQQDTKVLNKGDYPAIGTGPGKDQAGDRLRFIPWNMVFAFDRDVVEVRVMDDWHQTISLRDPPNWWGI
jgi:hypothetical protein